MTDKIDGRKRPQMRAPKPPEKRTTTTMNQIMAMVDDHCYAMFYEISMRRGKSGADTIRELIREDYNKV